MFIKMMAINMLFLIITRFREIEVQIAKDHTEITFNIFRKLSVTKGFRNIFITIVTVLQIGGIVLIFKANLDLANNNYYATAQNMSPLVLYGSFAASTAIVFIFLGFLAGFII